MTDEQQERIEQLRREHPGKFDSEEAVFARIRPGDRIFIGTGCGEPQYLVRALAEYVRAHPKAFFDAELLHVWTLGVTPYLTEPMQENFRLNSFFVGDNTREAVNRGLADYTPVFLSQVPRLFSEGLVPVNVALIQVSPPDQHGYLSLGISVDIVKAAVQAAALVIAQVNPGMPVTSGDGFLRPDEIDWFLVHEEPLLEYEAFVPDEIAERIGHHVAGIVQDGDTIQVGYGSIPNAIMGALAAKRHLGVHTELLTDGLVELMRCGAVDNSRKSIDRGKTVTSFCMGRRETYALLDRHPAIEFRTIDYTNDPLVIARQANMTAINSALEVDLTGQASAESIGHVFYSGIGGQADFMRGAVLAPGGKSILALQSTARDGGVSRIVPFLGEGAGVTLNRGDVDYVVTEYGAAYLHGKNVRGRAMDLIAIAHPDFRPWLIEEAKKRHLIYPDQAFMPGRAGEYPEHLEAYRTTRTGLELLLRPIKISDEPLLKDFFYSLSPQSMRSRFVTARRDMPHSRLQQLVVIDYTKELVILALVPGREKSLLVGVGEYYVDERSNTAEVAFTVRDDHQNQGVGTEMLAYLILLAKKQGLHAFTAEVLADNKPMLRVFQKANFDIEMRSEDLVYELRMKFRD
ncbi:MAG: GNAT family N-acetyltransferase [Acidobacteria bacterium]|nr:GNAT family N-acetyltransferase [Acidobacteriota bacterium]